MKRLSLLLLVGLLCLGCDRGPQPEFRLTYSVFFPPTHVQAQLAKQWAEEIETATSNRVKILVFAGASLTKANQCYQGVVDGISDIGMSCFSYTPGRFPVLEGLDLPLGYPDGVNATRIVNEVVQPLDLPELRDTHLLYLHAHGPGVLASREPVDSLDALSNLKVRGTGLTARIIKTLHGDAIGMSQPETYDALSKGVVKATLCPVETLKGWRQGECIRAVTYAPALGYTTAMFVTMNRETWASLPADIQTIITQINQKFVEKHGEGWNAADLDAERFLDELHCQRIFLDPNENARWKTALAPIFNDYVARAAQKGMRNQAEALLEALRTRLAQIPSTTASAQANPHTGAQP